MSGQSLFGYSKLLRLRVHFRKCRAWLARCCNSGAATGRGAAAAFAHPTRNPGVRAPAARPLKPHTLHGPHSLPLGTTCSTLSALSGVGASRAARAAPRAAAVKGPVNKVVLAYSGGLDTSVILKWLKEEYDCEVITFTADLGQARPSGRAPETLRLPVTLHLPMRNHGAATHMHLLSSSRDCCDSLKHRTIGSVRSAVFTLFTLFTSRCRVKSWSRRVRRQRDLA
jgi:Arginosuccinate synthase